MKSLNISLNIAHSGCNPILCHISLSLILFTTQFLYQAYVPREHFQQPSYLAALVPRYVPTRSLRSSSSLSICIPSRKTAMARSKSFSSVASDTWNRLPCHLSSISALPAFRKRLKHHLFSTAFPGISSPSTDITLLHYITFHYFTTPLTP